jgi:hypothetical protein
VKSGSAGPLSDMTPVGTATASAIPGSGSPGESSQKQLAEMPHPTMKPLHVDICVCPLVRTVSTATDMPDDGPYPVVMR